jgi:two-component system, NarL family, sensor histidine kinase UhpB
MKNLALILICCAVFYIQGVAQTHKADSLLRVLENAKEDTAKVNTLNQLAYIFMDNDPDTAIFFASEAEAISMKLDYKMGIVMAKPTISKAYINLGKLDEALEISQDALKLCDELLTEAAGTEQSVSKSRILMQKARNYNNIGIINYYQGNYPEALKNYLSYLEISEEIGNKRSIATSSANIGIVYSHQGNYPEALKNYYTALKIYEETGDKEGMSRTYNNIGTIYNVQGNYSEALKIFNLSLKIRLEMQDKQGISHAYRNIGVIYGEQGNFTEALKNLFLALKYSEECGEKRGIAASYLNIGGVYNDLDNYPEALKYFFAALEVSEEIGYQEAIAILYNNIGKVYFNQRKYNEAYEYYNKGLSLAKDINNLNGISVNYQALVACDSAQGNFNKSLEHYKLYIAARDSLNNQGVTQKLTQFQMQYEFDKKESLAKAEQEKKDAIAREEFEHQKLMKNISIGGIGLLIVLSVLLYLVFRTRHKLRLNDIRNKIAGDLHDDIGSTLNSISIYSEVARKKDENYDEALQMIGEASRKIIDAMSDIVWTINAENDSFEKIIFRMKSLAYNLFRAKNIEFTFQTDEILNDKKLSLEERRNFYLIFKEAVNNLVKYSGATRASLSLTWENGRVRLNIRDNGVGFDTSQSNAGNGLKNMKRRADEMKAVFTLESQPGNGTQIDLILKL